MQGRRSRRNGWIALSLALAMVASACATSNGKPDAELASRRAESHFNIAADHAENGRIELALRELLAAERLDPRDARTQHALGIAYLRKGKVAEAEAHMLRAIELAPRYHEARYNLSTLYLNQERYEECIRHSQLLDDDPTFTTPWRALTNWGWAAFKLGSLAEAREHLERAREYAHAYWPTHLNLGILEATEGNREAAIRSFETVLALRPDASAAAEASYRIAEIYVSMGRRVEAMGHLRTAVVKAPSDPWGKKSEAYLRRLR